jgi:hypothetical protein
MLPVTDRATGTIVPGYGVEFVGDFYTDSQGKPMPTAVPVPIIIKLPVLED